MFMTEDQKKYYGKIRYQILVLCNTNSGFSRGNLVIFLFPSCHEKDGE
jgi:hypothetical protein